MISGSLIRQAKSKAMELVSLLVVFLSSSFDFGGDGAIEECTAI